MRDTQSERNRKRDRKRETYIKTGRTITGEIRATRGNNDVGPKRYINRERGGRTKQTRGK